MSGRHRQDVAVDHKIDLAN